MANDPTVPADVEAAALTGPQNSAISTQLAAVATAKAGRQESDIPIGDPYWNTLDVLRRLYDADNADDVILF